MSESNNPNKAIPFKSNPVIPFDYDKLLGDVTQEFERRGYDATQSGSNINQIASMISYVASMLNVQTAFNINETLLPLSRKRKNILQNARLLGYEATKKTSYIYSITLIPKRSISTVIPRYTEFKIGGKNFVYMDEDINVDVDIETDNNYGITLELKEGEIVKSSVEHPELVFVMDGVTQHVDIPYKNVEDNGIDVFVDYFDIITRTSHTKLWTKHNMLKLDQNDRINEQYLRYDDINTGNARIYFQKSGIGTPLSDGTKVKVNILISSGSKGKPSGNEVELPEKLKMLFDVSGNAKEIRVGYDEESDESIKLYAPLINNAASRCITSSDYEAVCRSIPSVKDVKVWGGEGDLPSRKGQVYYSFVPNTLEDDFKVYAAVNGKLSGIGSNIGSETPHDIIKLDIDNQSIYMDDASIISESKSVSGNIKNPGVLDIIDNYKLPVLDEFIRNPVYIYADVDVDIDKYASSKSKNEVRAEVFEKIKEYFEDYGGFDSEYIQSNLQSAIGNALANTAGVNVQTNFKAFLSKHHKTRKRGIDTADNRLTCFYDCDIQKSSGIINTFISLPSVRYRDDKIKLTFNKKVSNAKGDNKVHYIKVPQTDSNTLTDSYSIADVDENYSDSLVVNIKKIHSKNEDDIFCINASDVDLDRAKIFYGVQIDKTFYKTYVKLSSFSKPGDRIIIEPRYLEKIVTVEDVPPTDEEFELTGLLQMFLINHEDKIKKYVPIENIDDHNIKINEKLFEKFESKINTIDLSDYYEGKIVDTIRRLKICYNQRVKSATYLTESRTEHQLRLFSEEIFRLNTINFDKDFNDVYKTLIEAESSESAYNTLGASNKHKIRTFADKFRNIDYMLLNEKEISVINKLKNKIIKTNLRELLDLNVFATILTKISKGMTTSINKLEDNFTISDYVKLISNLRDTMSSINSSEDLINEDLTANDVSIKALISKLGLNDDENIIAIKLLSLLYIKTNKMIAFGESKPKVRVATLEDKKYYDTIERSSDNRQTVIVLTQEDINNQFIEKSIPIKGMYAGLSAPKYVNVAYINDTISGKNQAIQTVLIPSNPKNPNDHSGAVSREKIIEKNNKEEASMDNEYGDEIIYKVYESAFDCTIDIFIPKSAEGNRDEYKEAIIKIYDILDEDAHVTHTITDDELKANVIRLKVPKTPLRLVACEYISREGKNISTRNISEQTKVKQLLSEQTNDSLGIDINKGDIYYNVAIPERSKSAIGSLIKATTLGFAPEKTNLIKLNELITGSKYINAYNILEELKDPGDRADVEAIIGLKLEEISKLLKAFEKYESTSQVSFIYSVEDIITKLKDNLKLELEDYKDPEKVEEFIKSASLLILDILNDDDYILSAYTNDKSIPISRGYANNTIKIPSPKDEDNHAIIVEKYDIINFNLANLLARRIKEYDRYKLVTLRKMETAYELAGIPEESIQFTLLEDVALWKEKMDTSFLAYVEDLEDGVRHSIDLKVPASAANLIAEDLYTFIIPHLYLEGVKFTDILEKRKKDARGLIHLDSSTFSWHVCGAEGYHVKNSYKYKIEELKKDISSGQGDIHIFTVTSHMDKPDQKGSAEDSEVDWFMIEMGETTQLNVNTFVNSHIAQEEAEGVGGAFMYLDLPKASIYQNNKILTNMLPSINTPMILKNRFQVNGGEAIQYRDLIVDTEFTQESLKFNFPTIFEKVEDLKSINIALLKYIKFPIILWDRYIDANQTVEEIETANKDNTFKYVPRNSEGYEVVGSYTIVNDRIPYIQVKFTSSFINKFENDNIPINIVYPEDSLNLIRNSYLRLNQVNFESKFSYVQNNHKIFSADFSDKIYKA